MAIPSRIRAGWLEPSGYSGIRERNESVPATNEQRIS